MKQLTRSTGSIAALALLLLASTAQAVTIDGGSRATVVPTPLSAADRDKSNASASSQTLGILVSTILSQPSAVPGPDAIVLAGIGAAFFILAYRKGSQKSTVVHCDWDRIRSSGPQDAAVSHWGHRW